MWHLGKLLLAFWSLSSAQYAESLDEAGAVSNATVDTSPRGSVGYKYGAYVERVSFQECARKSAYTPYFYQGFVANTRGIYDQKQNYRLGFAVYVKNTGGISGTRGPVFSNPNVLYHSWEMLHMTVNGADIRTSEPPTLRLHLAEGLPQIYIPLYMDSASSGDAYMLHLYPERSFLANPSSYNFMDGVLWAMPSSHVVYYVEIDVAGLIRNLDNFKAPNYTQYVQGHGVIVVDKHNVRAPWGLTDYRQITLKPTTIGGANEFICGTSPRQSAYTWAEFRQILDSQFEWL